MSKPRQMEPRITQQGKQHAKYKDGKNDKNPFAHSKSWNKSIKVNSDLLEVKEQCPTAIFKKLDGWERHELCKVFQCCGYGVDLLNIIQ